MKALLARAALTAGLLAATSHAAAARLVIWMVGDDKTPQVMQPAVEAYRARHPDVAIEVRDVTWTDAMTKYSAAPASKRGPDLVTGSTSYAVPLGAKGALVDSLLASLPTVLLFPLFQKQFVAGLQAGATKG